MVMVKSILDYFLTAIRDTPFRVIELAVSTMFFFYGVYMFTPAYMAPLGSPFWLTFDPTLELKFTSILYMVTGLGLFLAARHGGRSRRRLAQISFFSAILFSVLLRVTEFGVFSIGSLFLTTILVTLMVDILHTAAVIRDR